MSHSPPLPDANARRQAVLTHSHAFVWAGAGTGKTHTLTLRALYLLLNAPFWDASQAALLDLYSSTDREKRMRAARRIIRSLVLTTFTRKAAAEMQTRLYGYLERLTRPADDFPTDDPLLEEVVSALTANLQSSRLDDAPQRLRRGAAALAELAAELQVSTLHSFAASILRRHPLLAGIPPQARFAREDESDLTGLPRQLVERWWTRQALSDPEIEADLSEVLKAVPLEQVNRWLEAAVEHPWIAKQGERSTENPERVQRELEEALGACRRLIEVVPRRGSKGASAVWKEFARRVEQARAGQDGSLTQLSRFLRRHPRLFLEGDPYSSLQAALPELSEEQRFYFQQSSNLDRAVVRAALKTELAAPWEAFQRVLRRFGEWVRDASVRELNLVTFDDMIRLAVRLLENHSQVRKRERERLRALLVDEFQDTDPGQLRLISALLKRTSRKGHQVLGFFVGDLKQSIYRFRGADLGSIQHFYKEYTRLAALAAPPESYQLTTCFRSLGPVVDFVNRFFQDPVPLSRAEEHLFAFRKPGSGPTAAPTPQWSLVQKEGAAELKAGQERQLLAWEAVRSVQRLEQKGVSLGQISLLVRKERELNPLLEALDRAAIPAVSSGARTFYRQPEVLDLINLLIACHHPGDRLAAAAVLRSPIVDLDDRIIDQFLPAIQEGRLFHSQSALPNGLPEGPRRRIEEVRRLVDQRLRMDSLSWLNEVRQALPQSAYVRPHDREGRSLIRIDRLMSRYLSVASGQSAQPPLVWLIEQRQRADRGDHFDADLGEDVSAADESVDAVRVLTVHKAKGLENRVVIVYGWQAVLEDMQGEFPGGRIPQLLDILGAQGEPLREFRLPFGRLWIESERFQEGLQEEKANNRREAMRLAYVAATRARDRLELLSAHPLRRPLPTALQQLLKEAGRQLEQLPEDQTVLACDGTLRIRRCVPSPPDQKAADSPILAFDQERYLALWQAREASMKAPARLWFSPTDSEHPGEEEWSPVEESDLLEGTATGQRASNRVTGILVHRYLELHLGEPDFQPRGLDLLARGENCPLEARERAGHILERFFSGLSCDPAGRPYRIRLQECRIVARELPVYLQVEGRPCYGVIDLVLESGQGILGVDYKSTPVRRPLPGAYARQRQIYSQALRGLYPNREVTFEFWWLGGEESSEERSRNPD